jgi:hypothetical protein
MAIIAGLEIVLGLRQPTRLMPLASDTMRARRMEAYRAAPAINVFAPKHQQSPKTLPRRPI